MGIYGELEEMSEEQKQKEADKARVERVAERIAREKASAFIVTGLVHECRDREPADWPQYDNGFHDGFVACLQRLAHVNEMEWRCLVEKAKEELGLYRCPE